MAGTDLPYHFLYGALPNYVLVAIDQELSYKPVGYDRTDAYLRGDWDGRVQLFKQSRSGSSWYFASGLLSRVTNVLDIFGVPYTVQEATPKEFDPHGFEWVSPLTLRSYQQTAVDKAYAARGGVISLPTGAGKTVVGLKLVSMFDVPTLILVHTRELLYQWRDEIKLHLGVDAGLVGDGQADFRAITVATLQTIGGMIRSGDIQRLEFGMLLLDECLPYSTPVITDVGELPIGEIVEKRLPVKVLTHTGQFKRILGYQKIPLVKRLVRVTHEYGDLVCTEDHKILTRDGWICAGKLCAGSEVYCVSESGQICLQNLWKGVRVDDVTRGSCINGPLDQESRWHSPCLEGNVGCPDSGGARCDWKEVARETQRMAIWCRPEGGSASVDPGQSDGGYEHRVCEPEKFIPSSGCEPFYCASRVRSVEILNVEKSGINSPENDGEWWMGVACGQICNNVAAVLHADSRSGEEGSRNAVFGGVAEGGNEPGGSRGLVSGRRFLVKTSELQIPEGVWAQHSDFPRGFDPRGDGYGKGVVGAGVGDPSSFGALRVSQAGSFLTQAGICDSDPQYRGCGRISGDCASDCPESGNGLQGDAGLYVYDITVEGDHSFVADGVVVHNCHRVGAEVAYNIAMRCTARIRCGLSATPTRTDNAELKIFAATGPLIANLTPCDLIKAGYLAKPKLTLVSVGGSPGFFSQSWQKEYVAHIVTNDERNDKIVDEVVRLVREGKQTYIHVERVAHMDILYHRLVKEFDPQKVARIWGKTKTDDRQKMLKRFESGSLNVLIGTILKEGVNLPAMDAIVLAGGLSSPVALVQKVGRALRRNERFDYAEIIDFVDNCGRFCKKHSELRYQAFMEYYGDCIEIVRA